ncbi:hypothetical protein [Photobacterium kagoshimensis]|uniref:hypothetical protein n=1 Tax=Photobacterium kagoshimensis TaxID=2910242 RepID=UPI003D0CDE3D
MWFILFVVIKYIKRAGIYAVSVVTIYSYGAQAGVLPTSKITVDAHQCRLDFFHLAKNQQQEFEPIIQLAMVYTKNSQSRYVAIKRKIPTDIHTAVQYENIQYQRAHKPVAVFTTYWQSLNKDHQIGGLVVLGSDNYQQAFDKITSLMFQDEGHFELSPQQGKSILGSLPETPQSIPLPAREPDNNPRENKPPKKHYSSDKTRQGIYQFYVQDDHLAQFKHCLSKT